MPLYLARLTLNRECRAVREDLADCQAMHNRVMGAFPKGAGNRATLGVLYRVDVPPVARETTLLVQAKMEPVWNELPEGYLAQVDFGEENPSPPRDVSEPYAKISEGARLRFRLCANPTRRVDRRRVSDQQDRLSGKRVALLKERGALALVGAKRPRWRLRAYRCGDKAERFAVGIR